MAYIGNTASTRYVANRAASVYSGNGSTVAFTLEEAVGSDEDILVSVDGVVQEPSVGYAVSSGTTLTFTAAPSSNAGNNIFVYYLSLAKGSIVHPSNVGLTATTGAFSSNATVAGTLGVTGAVTLSTKLATTNLATGAVVQMQVVQTGTFAEGTTVIPFDNTIPQITEGDEYMTLAITPKASTNRLFIQAVVNGSGNATGDLIAALFVGTTANALAVSNDYDVSRGQMIINYSMIAGATSELTFRIRAGRSSSGTFYFNGYHDSLSLFGGTYMSSITITEIAV